MLLTTMLSTKTNTTKTILPEAYLPGDLDSVKLTINIKLQVLTCPR